MMELFDEQAINVRIYLGKESTLDPYEKNTDYVEISNSIPLRAIVTDVSPSKAVWKMPGVTSDKIKQLILPKKHLPLILQSQKITIQGDDSTYYGYKIEGKMSIVTEGEFIRVYIYVKKEA